MCGIVGYIGFQGANDVLLDGLHRLEYRGYDSSGTAVLTDEGSICVTKAVGRIRELESVIDVENRSIGVPLPIFFTETNEREPNI